MDPVNQATMANQIPITPVNSTQKRAATSPLDNDLRNMRSRTTENSDVINSGSTTDIATEQTTNNEAIHNKYFPTFKILRKLNNKLVTARHHKTFLTNLQERGQVPKGLQIKSAPTGAELDLQAYKQWEEAHIELANKLRDILIAHWTKTEAYLSEQITQLTEDLQAESPAQQSTLILTLIEKANNSKALELQSRRRRKERTATSGAGQAEPSTSLNLAGPTPPAAQ